MKGAPEACVSEDGVCCKDSLPMKFKDPKFMKFHENRHEALILVILFHNFFAIIFSIIKVIIELFIV